MLFIAFETAPFDWGIKVRADGFFARRSFRITGGTHQSCMPMRSSMSVAKSKTPVMISATLERMAPILCWDLALLYIAISTGLVNSSACAKGLPILALIMMAMISKIKPIPRQNTMERMPNISICVARLAYCCNSG